MPHPRKRRPRRKKKPQAREGSRPQLVASKARDIPGRRVDQSLQESHALLRAVIEGTPDVVFMKDLQGRYLIFNSTAARTWGRTVEETLGRTDFELFPHDVAEKFRVRDQHVIASGETITYEDPAILEGAARTFLVTKGPVRDHQGNILGVFGLARDITERKRAEQSLQESHTLLSAVIEGTPDEIFLKDLEGRYLMINTATARQWGYSVEQVVGKTDAELYPPELVQKFRERDQQVISTGLTITFEDFSTTAEGTRTFLVTKGPIRDHSGNIVGIFGIGRDITERQRTQEALRASEARIRAILETEPECVKRVAADGTLLEMNPAGLAMIEAGSAAQVLGKSVYSLVVPEHRDAFRALVERICHGGSGRLEFEIVGLRGTRRWLETHAVPLRSESDGVTQLLGVTRDITDRKRAEEELRRNERSLAEAQRIAHLGNWDWKIATNELRWSDEIYRIFGLTPQSFDATYEAFLNSVHPADREFVQGSVDAALRDRKPYSIDHRIVLPDGTQRIVHEQAEVSRDESGRPLRMVGTVQDITERKRAESQMLVQAAALESAANAIVITDRDGCITWVNPSFTRLTGFSAEEAIGKNPRILKSGQQDPAFYRQMWQAMLAGNVWRGEVINKRKDGTLYYEDMTITPVHDSTGEIRHFVAIKQDVTSQKKAEEALRQSEAHLRGLFENATLGVYRSTQEGRFLDVNPALVSMLGYNSQKELLAVSIAEDIYANPADRERALKDSAESFQNVPLQWKRKDGTSVSVLLTGRVVRDARGAFAYFESFVEDVTERQALEKQFYAAQKFEAIGHLAGGVAHDFNNVLGAILGWAELGLDSVPEDSKVRKNFRVIVEQAQHAAGLTRQLLAFARRQHMEPRVLNLNNSVREVSSLLGSVIGRDIELKTSLAPNLSSVLADPTHLEQVLMNLCVNARDAMPRGGKLIIETKNAEVDEDYCRLHPYAQPGPYVRLSVSDTGVGMDAATLDRIFEPFFTTKELGKGTGLGLATVYGITKQHGGFIHAYSELGQGTTFHLYFPACPEAPLNAKKVEAPALRGGDETILIAEDNEELAALARAALEGVGYSVLRARDGEEAVSLFELHRDRVALLVFDVVMPKLNGPDAYVEIRALRDTVPALFISGHSFESLALSSLVERGAELLQKPYSSEALLLKVRELLDRT